MNRMFQRTRSSCDSLPTEAKRRVFKTKSPQATLLPYLIIIEWRRENNDCKKFSTSENFGDKVTQTRRRREFIAHAENCARADVALPILTRNKQLLLIDKMR